MGTNTATGTATAAVTGQAAADGKAPSSAAVPGPTDGPAVQDVLKTRLKALAGVHGQASRNWQIRVHRCLSWWRRADALGADQPEARFILLWIAVNCLYSRWDNCRNAPDADAAARRDFVARVCRLDPAGAGAVLRGHRGLVKKLLDNPFLSEVFWRNPQDPKAKGYATQDANYLDRNLKAGDYGRVLGQALERVFVFRGQLVHGASSGGSSLNRKTLGHCTAMLEVLLPWAVTTVIERGAGEDWPELCYPPV